MCDQQSLRSACAYAQSDQSLCKSLEYFMSVKLLAERHLEFVQARHLSKCHIVENDMSRLKCSLMVSVLEICNVTPVIFRTDI